jgi:hypothetical protein
VARTAILSLRAAFHERWDTDGIHENPLIPGKKLNPKPEADVAQLVEQPIRNRQVSGSSPLVGSRFQARRQLVAIAIP